MATDSNDGTASRRTTIYDLAQTVGTSPSAVSAVLNGSWRKRRISQGLAERVLRAAEEQGYARNLQASLLRSERSNIVGMIIPKYDNRYFGGIAERFEALARDRGMFPVITCTQRDPDLELEAARELISYRVECLISTGATDPDRISDFCSGAGVRTINVDLPGRSAPSIISDNYSGARDLTRVILDRTAAELGETDPLLFIGGRGSDHNTVARIDGFREAHAERGLIVPDALIVTCGYAADKAERALDALAFDLPAGLFVNSTITLEGVVRWLHARGPDHARAVRYGCFDWDPFAALLPENVAMVQQDIDGMLRTAFEIMEGRARQHDVLQVPCILWELDR